MQEKLTESSQFEIELEKVLQQISPQIRKQLHEGLKNQKNRQKLKIIKKIIEGQGQSESKKVLSQRCSSMFLEQYIFGKLQSKPTILNIFKVLNVPTQILTSLTPRLGRFQQMKLTIEVIQMLMISNRLSASDKNTLIQSDLIQKIYLFLIQEFEKGTGYITKNQFRNKWLQQFVEILRCVNYIIKFIGKNNQKFSLCSQRAYGFAQQCSSFHFLLNKEIISQLYIILLALNNNQKFPQFPLQQIHYLHACTIVLGQNTLKPLLKLAIQLKDTEHKAQLAQILLKSFNQFIQQSKKNKVEISFDEEMKSNSFDYAISLFDVGRSIYSYLQQIMDIIIANGANWSLEGNYTRKFFIAKVALKHVSTKTIFELWPTCLQDCLVQSGNMTMAYVSGCAEILLTKLYEQLGKDYQKWMNIWIQPYKKSLLSKNRLYMRGITEFINPILIRINSQNSCLLKQILSIPKQNLNAQLGIISLIKCYKQIGKIQSTSNIYLQAQMQKKKQLQKIKLKEKKQKKLQNQQTPKQQSKECQQKDARSSEETKTVANQQILPQKVVFVHLDDPSFSFDLEFLLDLLVSNDPMTALSTFQFLITSRKPSYFILPQQMKLIMLFYKNCLKTSIPEYRKNYLNLTKRMLERFRNNYEKDIAEDIKKQKNLKKKQSPYFQDFIQFLNELIEFCFFSVYPDSIFEITNPALQILSIIVSLFGPKGCEIRKGTYIQPCEILNKKTTFFKIENFENLVICMQSSYESIRSIAYNIIKVFHNFDDRGLESLRKVWAEALQNTNKLSIKSYEFACRMFTYVSSLKINQKNVVEILQIYSLQQLNVCHYLLEILRKRYEIFKKQFIEQGQTYYQNLIHGILTCFSYILDDVSQIVNPSSINLTDINAFLSQFFKQIIKILNFSVQISSANNSTVVLDTIANSSQTDKKLTVDCRGHFLTSKKVEGNNFGNTIGSYLDSTALLSSMENEEEGIQNTLVVSFYLLTRESGLVFQSIGSLMGNNSLAKHVPKKQLTQLVNTYFYALINLKHMGSVDRISNGLSKMAKVIFDQEDTDLMKIPEQLLSQLFQFLTDGKFTTILRRSAGVPFAFSCLLKSQAIKRKLLIEKTICTLLKLSQQSSQTSIELRVHSLNILKKLFQDSDLKQDLDIYVSSAFILSIKGFTSEEWGVRNSSLMLFSVLANRTVGIKPTFNLLQFFHKCPDLFEFIGKQLSEKKTITMYPPLYPIVLLLSRLLPFDLRQRARIPAKGNTNKQMRKQQLLALLPLLRQAGNNHNYMGRVMTAKAILPFMHLNHIIPHCISLFQLFLESRKKNNINNNWEHYRLTECFQLLHSYHQIISCSDNPCYVGINVELGKDLSQQLKQKIYLILLTNSTFIYWKENGCVSPTVQEILIRIYNYFVTNYFFTPQANHEKNFKLYEAILQNAQKLFEDLINRRDIGDLGYSLMYKSCIELLFTCYKNVLNMKSKNVGDLFIKYLTENIRKLNNQKQNDIDYEILCLVFQKATELIKHKKEIKQKKEINEQSEFQLSNDLNQLLRDMNVEKVKNDDTLIRVLSILSTNQSIIIGQKLLSLIKKLQKIEKKSQNKHMKVAIFEFLLTISPNQIQSNKQSSLFMQSLLFSYSNPDQLEDLRQCCVLFLEKGTIIRHQLLIVYLRLLDDEQYQIRRRSACAISKTMGIKPTNQIVLIKELLSDFLGGFSYINKLKSLFTKNYSIEPVIAPMNQRQKQDFLISLLLENSDYKIRLKNHTEQRIFSYDKPNKYRTDINILYETVTLMKRQSISSCMRRYKKDMIERMNLKSTEELIQYEQGINELLMNYRQKVMRRDQYQFQTIIRTIMMANFSIDKLQVTQKQALDIPPQLISNIVHLHPMLHNIFHQLMKVL